MIASKETDESELRFYPNPVADRMTVEVKGRGTVKIFDRTGFNKVSFSLDETTNTIDLQQLQPGNYVIELTTKGGTHRKHLAKK
jgi:hypothetical protein